MGTIPVFLPTFNRCTCPYVCISDLAIIASDSIISSAAIVVGKYCVDIACKPAFRIQQTAETLLQFAETHQNEKSVEGYFLKAIGKPCCCLCNASILD